MTFAGSDYGLLTDGIKSYPDSMSNFQPVVSSGVNPFVGLNITYLNIQPYLLGAKTLLSLPIDQGIISLGAYTMKIQGSRLLSIPAV